MNKTEDEKSPIFGSWKNTYGFMIFFLVLIIVGLYFFTKNFS